MGIGAAIKVERRRVWANYQDCKGSRRVNVDNGPAEPSVDDDAVGEVSSDVDLRSEVGADDMHMG